MTFCRIIVAAMLLAAPTAPAVADPSDDPGKMRLGEFIPASPPQPAPRISFTGMDGTPAALADFKGKFVLLNVWATWCQPCLREMPDLEKLQAKLAPSLIVLAVSEDRGGAKTVTPFIARLGLDRIKVYLDPGGDVAHAIGVRGLPTSLVIDGDGKVLGRVEGDAEWMSPEMLKTLRSLLPDDTSDDAVKHAAR
jgi:thiol-disulfide isomerase/thioredoxin